MPSRQLPMVGFSHVGRVIGITRCLCSDAAPSFDPGFHMKTLLLTLLKWSLVPQYQLRTCSFLDRLLLIFFSGDGKTYARPSVAHHKGARVASVTTRFLLLRTAGRNSIQDQSYTIRLLSNVTTRSFRIFIPYQALYLEVNKWISTASSPVTT